MINSGGGGRPDLVDIIMSITIICFMLILIFLFIGGQGKGSDWGRYQKWCREYGGFPIHSTIETYYCLNSDALLRDKRKEK